MRRRIQFNGAVILATYVLILVNAPAVAGGIDGPSSTVGTVSGGMSVYYDISFIAGQPASVVLIGNGGSTLYLKIYDADGHTVAGTGLTGYRDRKTATMRVYRTGVFRVEVRNLGIRDNTFKLIAN